MSFGPNWLIKCESRIHAEERLRNCHIGVANGARESVRESTGAAGVRRDCMDLQP
jgi:hypothetical protein